MSGQHPFLEKLWDLEHLAHQDGVGLQAFDDFVHTPGVAEQLARLVETGTNSEAQSAARFLRFLRPCPARTVILRRVAALPPARRVRLYDMLMHSERPAFEEVIDEAREVLEAQNQRMLLVLGDKGWLDQRGPRPLSRVQLETIERVDAERRAGGVGVVTVFGHLLPLRLRKSVRQRLHELLGRQPGEPAARALHSELVRSTGAEDARRLRREIMRQASNPPGPAEGAFTVEVWPASLADVQFRLVHTVDGQDPVVLDGVVSVQGVVQSLRFQHDPASPAVPEQDRPTYARVDPSLFRGLLLRTPSTLTHETDVLLERMLGVPTTPFVLPPPAGRVGLEELRALVARGQLLTPPTFRLGGALRTATRATFRDRWFRRELVSWLRGGATFATLDGRLDDAAALLAEAAFVSSARRSATYEFAYECSGAASRPVTPPRLVPDPS